MSSKRAVTQQTSTWSTEPLGKHCDVRARIGWRGLSSSEYTEDGPFLIAGKHVDNGRIDWPACDHISEYRYRESEEIALKNGDVILTKDGTIGRVARIDSLPGEATINGTMMLLRPADILHYRFLFHLLNGQAFKKLVEDKVSGSSIPHIFQRDMVTLPIAFPRRAEQICVSDVLDTLDTAIRQTEAIVEKLKQFKQGLLHDLLTRGIDENGELRPAQSEAPHLYKQSLVGWIPKEWKLFTLGECATVASGVTLGRVVGGVGTIERPYLRVANVQDGYLDLSEIKTIRIFRSELSRFRLEYGDVLMNEGGDFDKLGRGTIWEGQIDECLHQNHVFRVRCDSSKLDPRYLAAYSASTLGKRYFVQASKQTTNLASINSTQLKKFIVGAPLISEQRAAVVRVAESESVLMAEKRRLETLNATKVGLVDDLLSGRVRVSPLLKE